MDPYVQQLSDAAHAVVEAWLERCVTSAASRMRVPVGGDLRADAAAMAREAAPVVLAELDALLEVDFDAQTSNPLSVLRAAVRHPTAVLVRHGVPTPQRDDFAVRAFPADVYALSPATWADIDESLQEPGLIWGAWKAKTVLTRRRAEGRLD
ncbi:MAG: hypothetical protein JWM34_1036 [Ilumatobacteraceae bacterium]|nr:hypothetical protein [Ilumatobacteraceae bacterium]